MCPPNTCCTCGANAPTLWTPLPNNGNNGTSAPSDAPLLQDPGACHPPMLCGLDANALVLSAGQQVLFAGPPAPNATPSATCQNDSPNPPILPPYIIEQLLRPLPKVGPRDDRTPPPPQSAITITDQNGILQISNKYDTTYRNGANALSTVYGNLENAGLSNDPAEITRLLDGTADPLATFRTSAVAVRDAHTRGGLSDYATIEGWLGPLYARFRPTASVSPQASEMVRLEGVMLGSNMAAINNADPTYRTGTAVKLLIHHQARALAGEWGGEARVLGLWGTNIAVAGIPEARVEAFRAEVARRVVNFLEVDQPLPASISEQMGAQGLRTSDLPARGWLNTVRHLGLTAGYRSTSIDAINFQPGQPNYVRGQADIEIISLLTGMAESEMEARRLGRPTFTGEVPRTSPVFGNAARPVLRTDAIIPPGTAPHTVEPLPAPEGTNNPLPTANDVTSGLVPRPAHEAGHSLGQEQRLSQIILQARQAIQSGLVEEAHRLIGQAMEFMRNPENRAPDQQPRTMHEFYEDGYRVSLYQHRFPGVFRLELFPQIARNVFGGERFFIQMAEYRDYWGHNRTHVPDAGDSMHRLTMDILARGYEYHGVEVLTGTQGGDEVYFAIRGQTADGRQLTDADIARISDYLGTNFNRIFQNVEHHEVTKAPMLPGGRFAGKNYLIQDGRVMVERGAYTPDQIPELLENVRIAYGQTINPANVTEVESLSKVGQVERLRLWSRVDAASGRVVEVFRPLGETPEGFSEVNIPLSTTITSAFEVPAGSSPEVTRLAMDRAGQQANEMKKAAVDRPRAPGAAPTEGPEAVVRIPLTDRLNATRRGRLFLHAGMFTTGDILSEGALQLFTGRSQLGSLDFYMNMARGYVLMAAGTYVGEGTARGLIAGFDGRLFVRQGERVVLNEAAFRAEYTGLRSAGVHGAGILGAVLLSELVTQGHLSARETAWPLGSMGTAMATSRLALYGVQTGLELGGVAATTRTALLRHPVTALIVIVGECLIMKGINRLREGWAREESEAHLRGNLGSAMRQLDFTLARTVVVRPDGSVDPEAERTLQTAVRRVTDAFGDYLMFQFANETTEGRAFLSAQQSYAESQSALDEFPEYRERIQANPAQEVQILEEAVADIKGRFYIGVAPRSAKMEGLLNAKRELTRAEAAFQEMIRRSLTQAPDRPIPVPMHQWADGFSAGLRRNPIDIYQQFQGYLTARLAYADERRVRGIDAAAIEAHYAPSPLVAAPARPLDLRLLLDPTAQEQNPLQNPLLFPLSGTGSPADSLFAFPANAGNGTGIYVFPTRPNAITWTNGTDLSWPQIGSQPTVTPNPNMAHLFYLDAQGYVRPMQPEDQVTAGAVWAYSNETHQLEMVRDLPTFALSAGDNLDLPVLDLNGTGSTTIVRGPVATLAGRTITIDRTGPRPVMRFVRQ
jgi:hypothetical protein